MLRAKDTCMDLKDVHNSNKDLKHEAQISDILYTVESSDRPKFGAYVQRVSLQLDAIIQDIICDTLLYLWAQGSQNFFLKSMLGYNPRKNKRHCNVLCTMRQNTAKMFQC
jgi:hypothetical protein